MTEISSVQSGSHDSPKWTIYCHTHIDSGRRYIGLTRQTWQARWDAHVYQAISHKDGWGHFQNAIRKYGKDAFSHEVLENCKDLDIANLAEVCWIEFYETRNPEKGFNIAKGGLHVPHPISNPWDRPEYRAKNLPGLIKRTNTPQARANNKAALNTPESRAKRFVISKATLSDLTVRAKISASLKGRVFSSEHRINLSAANVKRARDPGFAAKNKAHLDAVRPPPPSSLGRVHSDVTKEKISAANKGHAASSLAIENSIKSRREKAAAKTHFLCKTHGHVLLEQCFRRLDKVGRPRYECKECKRQNNATRRKSRRASCIDR